MPFQTSTNQYQNTKYIVDAAGGTPYATIQSAINAANTAAVPATIFIRAGTYTENLTLYDGIELQGSNAFQTIIIGLHTPPNAGRCALLNIGLQSATHILSSAAAGTASIKFSQCTFALTDGYVCNMTNWLGAILFELCADLSTVNGLVLNTATASISISACVIGAGTTKSLTSNGILNIISSSIGCPIALSGSAISIINTSLLNHTLTLSGNANLSIANSNIVTGADISITTTSTIPVNLVDVNITTSNTYAISGTGTVNFSSVTFSDSKALAGTIVEGLAGVVKTGEIYANTILRMDMSGFYSWAAAGPYFDATTLGTFQLLVGGTGYIRGKLVTWVAQNIAGMTSGATWYIYIDSTGTIGKTATRTDILFMDNIVLFECLYDETPVTKQQHVVKENHAYNYQVSVSNYLHNTAGIVIENTNNGANITVVPAANVKISIAGADSLDDHGLLTTIPDSGGAGVIFKKFYTTAGGKWAVQNTSDTFAGYYNNAGTPTALPGGKFAIYTLYVGKDSLNATTPTYYAVLDTVYYGSGAAANTAISNGTPAKATGELASIELAQLGYVVFRESTAQISQVTISKSTLRSTISTGGSSGTAALVNTVTTNFDGILSGADTNVQAALETIDDWGKTTTDHALLIGNGTGVAIGSLAVGGTGTILTGAAGADPAWTTATYPATTVIGNLLVSSAANVVTGLTTGATGTILTGVTGASPAWTTTTYPATTTIGNLLVSSAANVVTGLTTGTTGTILTGVTGASPAWTTTTYPATTTIGNLLVSSAANVVTGLTTGTTGTILTGVTGASPAWTTTTYPATTTIGNILVSSAANVVTGLTTGTTGTILTGVTGASPTWTTATYPATVATGDILAATNTNVVTVIAGTSATATYVLTGNGSGVLPSWQAPASGWLTWSEITGATQAMAVNNGYIANIGTLITFTLPASSAVGTTVRVCGKGAGGWLIAQNAGNTIYFGSSTSTPGVGGSLASSLLYDAVELVCISANANWTVTSCIGNITIV